MKFVALIPARYAATRFPAKLMQPIGNKTVIQLTYENTLNTQLFDEVIVVTDSEIIYNEIINKKGKAIMSKQTHESGSDRIAEAAQQIIADVIINVQGDEPFIDKDGLTKLKALFEKDTENKIQVASLMQQLPDADANDPNNVKVVSDNNGKALLFSRAAIPFKRDNLINQPYYLHIGVYAFRKNMLIAFSKLPPSKLEQTEKLENLRLLENGIPIYMIETFANGLKIDTPEDLVKAQEYYKNL